jgi:hypothetical protein
LYFDRRPDDRVARIDRRGAFAIDYAMGNRPIGVEFIDVRSVRLDVLNKLMAKLRQSPLAVEDVAPLAAA